jgi:hypothetical protein
MNKNVTANVHAALSLCIPSQRLEEHGARNEMPVVLPVSLVCLPSGAQTWDFRVGVGGVGIPGGSSGVVFGFSVPACPGRFRAALGILGVFPPIAVPRVGLTACRLA